MKTLLLIDDDEEFQTVASEALTREGYLVHTVPCPEQAEELLLTERYDLLVCDLYMPYSMSDGEGFFSFEVGVRTLQELHRAVPWLPMVALSSAPAINLKRIAPYLDPILVFTKPTTTRALAHLIAGLLENEDEQSQSSAGRGLMAI